MAGWKIKLDINKSLLDELKVLIDFHLRGIYLESWSGVNVSASYPEIPCSGLVVAFLGPKSHSLELFLICSKLASLRGWESATPKAGDSLAQDVLRQHCEPLRSQNNGPQCPGYPGLSWQSLQSLILQQRGAGP